MTPGVRRVARSFRAIQQKAERLRERDDLPEHAGAIRERALDCRKKLQWAHQRRCTTGWNDPDYQASLNELRVVSRAYRQALYELLAVAWIFVEAAPDQLFAAYRVSDIDELRPSRIQRHLGELHHLLRQFDLFLADGVEALLGEFDRLLDEFDQLCRAAREAADKSPPMAL